MSQAGIYSNMGDEYQLLTAIDWAITILNSDNFQWLEVDSTQWDVDDVVIGLTNGQIICCQCKKNQPEHKSWSFSDIKDELIKAIKTLSGDPRTQACFYSRTPFGNLSTLKEYSNTQPNQKSYYANLGKKKGDLDIKFKELLKEQKSNLSTFEFLGRCNFLMTKGFPETHRELPERLKNLVNNPEIAINALYQHISRLGSRTGESINDSSASPRHRLNKEDLVEILSGVGSYLTASIDSKEVRKSFAGTSRIGREWQRDIAGTRIPNPLKEKVLEAILAKEKSILITGSPGSGKTCLMIDLQESLEGLAKTQVNLLPIYIQAREYADIISSQERQSKGLDRDWVEKVARLADEGHVVVLIDSLDVLSIAREHEALAYFLAQIDRLLTIQQVTVVTSCRDFDRHYDKRLDVRKWGQEFKCASLRWEAEIIPILRNFNVDTQKIDASAKELISNPRELSIFIDLIKRGIEFGTLTSQSLAQLYLDKIIGADPAMGDGALKAIEAMSQEMLASKSLSIPQQRFKANAQIQRALLSHNVLQKNNYGHLSFGHQTLLDVLAIRHAIRQGLTLQKFIESLPPVPFVRPSIRAFIDHLAMGDRHEFRKQLRAALASKSPFHIHRLIAESFAQKEPEDDDWSMVSQLRKEYHAVFQLIYSQGKSIGWHYFWRKNLLPLIERERNSDAMTAYASTISRWVNDDASYVLGFWEKLPSLSWVNSKQFQHHLSFLLAEVDIGNAAHMKPILNILLDLPDQDHGLLGRAVVNCIQAGEGGDELLWKYVAGQLTKQDILDYRFDEKIYCQDYHFGSDSNGFFENQMLQSTALLDLAVNSISEWQKIKLESLGYSDDFLIHTSYQNTHTKFDDIHIDGTQVLFNAVEKTILHQSDKHTHWWKANSENLCFSDILVLRYFGLLGCTNYPKANISLIEKILSNRESYKLDLTYELGNLINTSFIYLNSNSQKNIMRTIANLWEELATDEYKKNHLLKIRAKLITKIPSHLRTFEAQTLIDHALKLHGYLVHQPNITSRGGMIGAPFSFDVLFSLSDPGILGILKHYEGHSELHDIDFLTGGEREVGGQLREAASRDPLRFLRLLNNYWPEIGNRFRDDIMSGVANFLSYRHRNLQPSSNWSPLHKVNDIEVAQHALRELEIHPLYWQDNSSASNVIEACAPLIDSSMDADRLVFLSLRFFNSKNDNPFSSENIDLITTGINMRRGHITDGLMRLATNLIKKNISLSDLLLSSLRRLANDSHPAIRALLLKKLPYLQSLDSQLGWELFEIAQEKGMGKMWKYAEPCLYHGYSKNFEKIKPILEEILRTGVDNDLETWGRISALAALEGKTSLPGLINQLTHIDNANAWRGSMTVWTNPQNITQHENSCFKGISAAISIASPDPSMLAQTIGNIFRVSEHSILPPNEIMARYFEVLRSHAPGKHHSFFGIDEWLNAIAQIDAQYALSVCEQYIACIIELGAYIFDHENNLAQLLTRLFYEAEEIEGVDQGEMLRRVIALQDLMLSLGVDGITQWLQKAESR